MWPALLSAVAYGHSVAPSLVGVLPAGQVDVPVEVQPVVVWDMSPPESMEGHLLLLGDGVVVFMTLEEESKGAHFEVRMVPGEALTPDTVYTIVVDPLGAVPPGLDGLEVDAIVERSVRWVEKQQWLHHSEAYAFRTAGEEAMYRPVVLPAPTRIWLADSSEYPKYTGCSSRCESAPYSLFVEFGVLSSDLGLIEIWGPKSGRHQSCEAGSWCSLPLMELRDGSVAVTGLDAMGQTLLPEAIDLSEYRPSAPDPEEWMDPCVLSVWSSNQTKCTSEAQLYIERRSKFRRLISALVLALVGLVVGAVVYFRRRAT